MAGISAADLELFTHRFGALAGSCPPVELLDRLNRVMFENSPPAKYVTAFYGELDPATGVFTYVNAGHNPPLVVCDGKARALDSTGPVVGLIQPARFTTGTERLDPGTLLLLYTDGVTECENLAEAEYGFERLTRLVERTAASELAAVAAALFDDLALYSAGAPPKDDTTAVLVRRLA